MRQLGNVLAGERPLAGGPKARPRPLPAADAGMLAGRLEPMVASNVFSCLSHMMQLQKAEGYPRGI